jgi:hypothetical protein
MPAELMFINVTLQAEEFNLAREFNVASDIDLAQPPMPNSPPPQVCFPPKLPSGQKTGIPTQRGTKEVRQQSIRA